MSSDHASIAAPRTRSPLWRTYGLYRAHLPLVALFLSLAFLANGTFGIQQHVLALTIDDLKAGSESGTLAPGLILGWVGWMLGIAFVRGLIGYGNGIVGMLLGQRVLNTLRRRLFDQVLDLDQAYHRQHGGGELIARTTRDSDKVRDAVVIGTRQVLEVAMYLVGGLIYVAWCDWRLALIPTVVLCLSLYLYILQSNRLVLLNRATDEAYDGMTQDFTEGVIGVRVVKAFAQEHARLQTFLAQLYEFMGRARSALLFTATRLPIPAVLFATTHAWVLVYGIHLVAEEEISIGVLIAVLMLMTGLVFRLDALGRSVRIFADARASAARVWEVLDRQSDLRSGTKPLPSGPLRLELDGVRVQAGERPILTDCSLHLAPGEILAVVGATGSGKSTLCSLLPRLRDPDAGTIRLRNDQDDTVTLADCQLDELRRTIQVVFQGSFLFSTTVAENLRLAAPGASLAELQAALQTAAAGDIVAGLPEGLDTVVGERGVTLSGGQRQRICLARALAARPRILVLDDATSALDAVTERRILDRLQADHTEVGVLIIAARLSSILLADRVALLDEGRIVAVGSHAELLATQPFYRQLLCLDEHGTSDPSETDREE